MGLLAYRRLWLPMALVGGVRGASRRQLGAAGAVGGRMGPVLDAAHPDAAPLRARPAAALLAPPARGRVGAGVAPALPVQPRHLRAVPRAQAVLRRLRRHG